MNRNLFSKRSILGGLIVCLIILGGLYFFLQSKVENPATNRIPREVSTPSTPKSDAPLDGEDNTTKPAPPVYYEGTTIPIMTEAEMWKVIRRPKYTGPQTVEALMDAYHITYLQNSNRRLLDQAYPPEPWLQYLLNRGFTIITYGEYVSYMNGRGWENTLDDDPNLRRMWSEGFGIPESDIEKLKAVYLEDWLQRVKRSNEAQRGTTETIAGGIHVGENFLPIYRDREVVYVQRRESSTELLGATLTGIQRFNLIFRGIEPKGIEVIYIDEMGNTLAEKPAPVTREEVRKVMAEGETPPPEDWWDPEAPIPDSDDFEKFLPPENPEVEPDPRAQRAREEAARQVAEAAQAEFEQFMRQVRQLEKFATLSDAEIATEIENQLRQQLLPELPTDANIEDALREIITPKPLTPERFQKAMRTLQRHGPKEGLRRIAKADPELAEYFLRNPQRVSTKRSQPSKLKEGVTL